MDLARDLEPGSRQGEWLILDAFGLLHSNRSPVEHVIGVPWPGGDTSRGFVNFPDGTRVMIDAFGGRHTNPYRPTRDVVDGLPSWFYFPGLDIIWDIEVVPENLMIN